MGRKIILIRIPKPAKEVVKGTDPGSVTNFKAAEDGIKGINFKLRSPVGGGSNLEIKGKQIGTVHAGRGSGSGAEDRILIPQPDIGVGKIEVPEAVNDIPSTAGDGIGVRIIFTKISNNKVLIGGMTARINR